MSRKYLAGKVLIMKLKYKNGTDTRPETAKRTVLLRYITAGAVILITIGIGISIWTLYSSETDIDKGLAALKKAYRNQRSIEARISSFDYAPLSTSRGPDTDNIDHLQRQLARSILVEAALRDSGFRSHHALGQLYLAELDFENAVRHLEAALKVDDKSASVHSDLGVALLEREKKRRLDTRSETQIEEIARSLEHFTRALELDDSMLEARFNRSLCYQELLLPKRAAEEWGVYLERDSNSGWAEEARKNLQQVEEKLKNPELSREQFFQDFLKAYNAKDDRNAWEVFSLSYGSRYNFILEKLIDDYLDLTAKGSGEEAQQRLQLLSYVGQLAEQKVGDRYPSYIARVYTQATPKTRRLLTDARAYMREGYSHSDHSEYKKSGISFQKAAAIFKKAGDDGETVSAELRIAQAWLRQVETKQAFAILHRLIKVSLSHEYRWLTGRIYYSFADAQFNYQDYSETLSYSALAAKESEQAGDLVGVVRALLQTTETYNVIGDSSRSLSFAQRALSFTQRLPIEPRQQMYFYSFATDSFSSLGLFAAALDYQKEALRLSLEIKEPVTTSRYYQGLGKIYRNLNNYDEAIKYAKLSFDEGARFSDEPAGQEMMAFSALTLGHLYREYGRLDEAINYYNQNIQIYDRLGSQLLRYEAHMGKFLCYKAKGDLTLAQQELDTALQLYEKNRSKLAEESNRNAFFDGAQILYDAAIDFEYSNKGNLQKAFEIAESGRARSLLDLTSEETRLLQDEYGTDINLQSGSKPLTLSEIQGKIPDQTQIIQYSVLKDKILIWVVSAGEIKSEVKEIAQTDLTEKVLHYLLHLVKYIPGQEEEIRREASELYGYLIEPIKDFIDKDKLICIVPDKLLNYLPYSSLLSDESGKYLIEDYTLIFAPSSTIFLRCTENARDKEHVRNERLLAVGNPSFDRTAFALADLPSAKREADRIARYYGSPAPFTGANATERAVKEAMSQADVIHLATHYVMDERSPMASKLLLASEGTDSFASKDSDGLLQAWEIYAMDLEPTRLVVLAACQTGVDRTYQGEGAVSIARPFIKAGVPLVVASLWAVESQSTSDLMINFHRYRKEHNLSSAEALRRAQRDMIESSSVSERHPAYWASFILIGGKALF